MTNIWPEVVSINSKKSLPLGLLSSSTLSNFLDSKFLFLSCFFFLFLSFIDNDFNPKLKYQKNIQRIQSQPKNHKSIYQKKLLLVVIWKANLKKKERPFQLPCGQVHFVSHSCWSFPYLLHPSLWISPPLSLQSHPRRPKTIGEYSHPISI